MSTWTHIWSTAFTLLFIIDPIGNIPVVLSVLRTVPAERHTRIIFRELLLGLVLMLSFLFCGKVFLSLFQLETGVMKMAGSVILFLVGIKMVFPDQHALPSTTEEEPFIVPIATPMIAGPSAFTTLVIMGETKGTSRLTTCAALLVAWTLACLIMISAPCLYRLLKEKGITALERITGILLLILSIQMCVEGARGIIATS